LFKIIHNLKEKAGPKFTESITENKVQTLAAIKKLITKDLMDIFVSNDLDMPTPHKDPEKINPKGLTSNTNKKNPPKKKLKRFVVFFNGFSFLSSAISGNFLDLDKD